MKKMMTVFTVVLILVVVCLSTTIYPAPGVTKISKEELKEKLDSPEVIVIDVRTDRDWKESEFKIGGAVREDPYEVDTWIDRYPKEKTLIFYCA